MVTRLLFLILGTIFGGVAATGLLAALGLYSRFTPLVCLAAAYFATSIWLALDNTQFL